ncbi:MAG: hypothetical protein RL621_320 [Bacteroidota bacterium]|jgi:hypothetical protein
MENKNKYEIKFVNSGVFVVAYLYNNGYEMEFGTGFDKHEALAGLKKKRASKRNFRKCYKALEDCEMTDEEHDYHALIGGHAVGNE